MAAISLLILAIMAVACGGGQEQESVEQDSFEHERGGMLWKLRKYIYRDDNNVFHVEPNCIKLREGKDEEGHDIYAKHPIDTADFYIKIKDAPYFRVCANCVSDRQYEKLLEISERNKQYVDERVWLYRKFVDANYDVPDFDTFCANLPDQETRKRLYNIAKEEGWISDLSIADFSRALGYEFKKNKLGL